jgi:hypothetical protein
MGDPIRHRRLAAPYAPLSLSEKRSHLDELRTQAMFSDSDLLSRRIRDLEAQIELESGRRSGERRAVSPPAAGLGPRRLGGGAATGHDFA